MPKVAKQLSDRAVAAIKTEGRHAVGGIAGLHLRISAGYRGWVLRVQVGDQRKDMGLGPYPAVSLLEARDKARKIHDDLRNGQVPISPKVRQRSLIASKAATEKTFHWCASEYLKTKAPEWKNAKHRQQWENTLEAYAMPHLGQLSVSVIDLPHILACLEPIWSTKNETASRLRGRIESVLDWATVRKYRSGENPARWKGHLDKVLAAPGKIQNVEHHRAIPVDDMPTFMQDLRTRAGIAAKALEFLIYTAARSGEVRGALWSEIDLNKAIWTIPASRMKAGVEHRVPLSQVALKLLADMPRIEGSNLIFPGTKGQVLSDMTMTAVMRRMESPAVPHGFRSTFRDWVGEKTQFPRELAEHALAHTLESKVEAAYRRGDALERRREMMQEWSKFISK
ncbi:tyrosine-type recombinase/integrase [Comamonas piscis]|uniref:Tyrosine-type recombinase/integrase n=1 Tax=Comamonas piscis TaxID=1562974 RepID=A0A7G5EGV2_9BURK|nr:site-specific integrase [Comamonas piscis]QMV73227.1 tyrosine-type recombinase/integrase [Comamonas piscis]WSO36019.1 integrase arm-type DNA-binding domain-containing protein [Comamonas piscis]